MDVLVGSHPVKTAELCNVEGIVEDCTATSGVRCCNVRKATYDFDAYV